MESEWRFKSKSLTSDVFEKIKTQEKLPIEGVTHLKLIISHYFSL